MTVVSNTCSNTIGAPLLSILQHTFPGVISYQLKDNIVQANAEGFRVITTSEEEKTDELFVKSVDASKYAHKRWGDLRRTLLYSRTEARFYSDILPLLQEKSATSSTTTTTSPSSSSWEIAPKCFFAESYLDGLIDEEESTAAIEINPDTDPKYDPTDTSVLNGRGGTLILDSMSSDYYYQTSPLSTTQASQCLGAIAKFHATAFQDEDILSQVSNRLCEHGGSYHLKNRNPREIRDMVQTWDTYRKNIGPAAPDGFFDRPHIRNLGQRMQDVAQYVSDQLSPSYKDDFATIVHGDYKAMNVFIPSSEDGGTPMLIDFASVGVGCGMSDVAMHIVHAIEPNDLEDGGEERLVEGYLDELHDALPSGCSYDREQAMRHYRLAKVDYFRFIMGRLWRNVTLEQYAERTENKNFALINRRVDVALAFIESTEKYLVEIEKEMKMKK